MPSPAGLPKGIGSPLSALLVAGAPTAGALSGTCADDGLPPCDACGVPAGFAGRAAATPANAGAMAAAEPKGSLTPDSGAFAKSACCRVSRTACRRHSHEHCNARPPACCLTAPAAAFAQIKCGHKDLCAIAVPWYNVRYFLLVSTLMDNRQMLVTSASASVDVTLAPSLQKPSRALLAQDVSLAHLPRRA